jgi:hypothetical protein
MQAMQPAMAGKWQLDGGDASIRKFGFDKYRIWLPFKICPEEAEGSRYKSAKIVPGWRLLASGVLLIINIRKICCLIMFLNFMDSNKTKPFFIYYSMILCHKAFFSNT